MTTTIWKYHVPVGTQKLQIPKGGIIRYYGLQDDEPYLWIEVDPKEAPEQRTFSVYGTGHNIRQTDYHLTYIGTIIGHRGKFVWHLYEREEKI